MFSTTTIESSTSSPSAITKPTMLSWLMEKPVTWSSATPIASESGIEIITTTEAREAQRQQRHQHQQDRDGKILAQPAEPALDIRRLVEAPLQPHSGWKCRLELVQLAVDRIADIPDALPFLHVGGDEHRALTVVASQMPGVPVPPRHRGHIAERDRVSPGSGASPSDAPLRPNDSSRWSSP